MTTQGRISKHLLGAQRTSKGTKPMNVQTDASGSYEGDNLNDKLDLHLLRGQMKSLLDQIGSLKKILKDQSDEINRLNAANEQLSNIDRRLATTQKKYRTTKNQNEEMKQTLAMQSSQNSALKAEVRNLKNQLEKINQIAKEKDLRILEMSYCHQTPQKKNEAQPVQNLANLEVVKENRVSELENKQLFLAKKNDDILVEISALRQEIAKIETRILNEQDSRKQGQKHMSEDLQQALLSLLQKYDILSNEIAQLKIKLDTSISLSKYSDLSHKETVTKNLAVNETESIRTSEVAKNAPLNDNESVSELSVETIRDVESLRRVLGKILPSYRQYFGDIPTESLNKETVDASQSSKDKADEPDISSSRGKQANNNHLSVRQTDRNPQHYKLQREKSIQDATPSDLITASKDQLKSSKAHYDNTDFCGTIKRKKKPLESTFFTGVEVIKVHQTELPVKSSRDPGQRSIEKGTNGEEQFISSSTVKVKDKNNSEERSQQNQELASAAVRYRNREVLNEGEDPDSALDSVSSAPMKDKLHIFSDWDQHFVQQKCRLEPYHYGEDSLENQLPESFSSQEIEESCRRESTLRHSSNSSATITSNQVGNSSALIELSTPILDLQGDQYQSANHLTAISKQRESWGNTLISGKMKEDKFSDSDLLLNKEKSNLDLNHNGNVTEGFIFSESSSVPASEPLKLMRVRSIKAKASDDVLLLDTGDIAKTKEQRSTTDQGKLMSSVAFDEISFAERSTGSHELSDETSRNENVFSSGRKLIPNSSFSLEEHQNVCAFQRDGTNDITKSDEFNANYHYNSEINPGFQSEVLLECASNYATDQLLDTTDALSMIEEEISINMSDSPHSCVG
jgi:hypothetical protein